MGGWGGGNPYVVECIFGVVGVRVKVFMIPFLLAGAGDEREMIEVAGGLLSHILHKKKEHGVTDVG